MGRAITLAMVFTACAVLGGCSPDGPRSASEPQPGEIVAVAKEDLHVCGVTGTPLTLEDCSKAQDISTTASRGAAAFNAPDVMRQGEVRTLVLAVGEARKAPPPPPPEPAAPDPTDSSGPAEAPPSAAAPPATAAKPAPKPPPPPADPTPAEVVAPLEGTTVEYAPIVGRHMAADLVGEGFEITPMSARIQPVSENGVTTWEWQVKALKSGDKTLAVKTLVVMIDSRGEPVPLKPTTQYKKIKVRVGLPYVWELLKGVPGWLQAITAILVAATALLLAWRKFGDALRPKAGN